jgi:hypothetical protein
MVPWSSSVVIACLEKINTVSTSQIHKAMLLGQQMPLHAGTKIFHRFTQVKTGSASSRRYSVFESSSGSLSPASYASFLMKRQNRALWD